MIKKGIYKDIFLSKNCFTGRVNDIRLLGMISLGGILVLAIVGMSWMTRVQYGLLVGKIQSQNIVEVKLTTFRRKSTGHFSCCPS